MYISALSASYIYANYIYNIVYYANRNLKCCIDMQNNTIMILQKYYYSCIVMVIMLNFYKVKSKKYITLPVLQKVIYLFLT